MENYLKILQRSGGGGDTGWLTLPVTSHIHTSALAHYQVIGNQFVSLVCVEASQCHTDTWVFEAHGQDSLVDLVKLHQLQEVDEEREAVVHGVVLPACLLELCTPGESQSGVFFFFFTQKLRLKRE